MATSGSSNFTRTRNQIITRALRIINVLGQGDVPSSEMVSEASEVLNSLIKGLQTEDFRLWTSDWVTKNFTASSQVTGTDSLIYTCIRSHTSAASNRPITGADYTTYWEKDGSTGGVWVISTAYSNIGDFTVDAATIGISNAFIRSSNTDYQVELISRDEYFMISDKTTFNRPTHLYFDPQLTPVIYLWPRPDETSMVLHYSREGLIEDFDNSNDNPDFPVRWIDVLIYGLASMLSDEYDIIPQKSTYLYQKYQELKRLAKNNDVEHLTSRFMKSAY